MKQIILSRHTETILIASNERGHRRNDSSLTDFGNKQAEEMKRFLESKGYSYEIAFSSLYQRSSGTADIISKGNNTKVVPTMSFAEYFLRDDDSDIETLDMAISRTMTKIYSMFELYDSILLVGHSSINKSILQNILNIDFEKSLTYFNKLGETHILRYDWSKGDTKWSIVDSFTPTQPE